MATITAPRISRFDTNTAVADRPNLRYHAAPRTYVNGKEKFTGLSENQTLELLNLYNTGKHENGKRYTLTDLELKFKVSKSYLNRKLKALELEGFEVKRRSAGVQRKTKNLPVLYNRPAPTSNKKSLVGFISLPVVTYRPTPSIDEVFGEGINQYNTVATQTQKTESKPKEYILRWENGKPVLGTDLSSVVESHEEGRISGRPAIQTPVNDSVDAFLDAANAVKLDPKVIESMRTSDPNSITASSTYVRMPSSSGLYTCEDNGDIYAGPRRSKSQRIMGRAKLVGLAAALFLGATSVVVPSTLGAIKLLSSNRPQTVIVDNYSPTPKKLTNQINKEKVIVPTTQSAEDKGKGAGVTVEEEVY